jgi:hypothetical protein
VAAFIYSLVDGMLVTPISHLLMATLIGWMIGLSFEAGGPKPTGKNNLATLLWAGGLLITLLYGVIPSLIPRLVGTDPATREHFITAPRFWMQGHLPD